MNVICLPKIKTAEFSTYGNFAKHRQTPFLHSAHQPGYEAIDEALYREYTCSHVYECMHENEPFHILCVYNVPSRFL